MNPLEFLECFAAISGGCAEHERFIFCGFPGSPQDDIKGKWLPRPWRPGDQLPINPHRTNGYLAISTFGRNERGQFRRIQEQFASGRCLMIDDVGTGRASKINPGLINLEPTARIETSLGNEQWLYVFREPYQNRLKLAATIDAFIQQKLLDGQDPGMKGVNRVFRLPGFINGKAQHDGWRVELLEFDPQRVFTIDGIISSLGLVVRRRARRRFIVPDDRKERVAQFKLFKRMLYMWGMLKRDKPNLAGWTDITCPWIEEHTARADTGTGIKEPSPENDWWGAFQCHHGHCVDRVWGDLTDWVALAAAEELEATNDKVLEGR